MGKKIILVFAALVILAGGSLASGVSRSFSSNVEPGADLKVMLIVETEGDETYYAIDELVPKGWTVKSSGSERPNKIKAIEGKIDE